MTIWANTIVNNEERFIWFSIMSVIHFVDKILVWDTGSKDMTVKIIKEIKRTWGDKIEFRQVGEVGVNEFSVMRQTMLDQSKCDWILVLDGDEIWWENSIKKLTAEIKKKGRDIEGIVVPFMVPVGDIYHLQEQRAGQYRLVGRKGHLSLRAFSKKIPGLHVDLPYGKESYLDKNNKPIQIREKIIFVNAPYLHVTHLKRSNSKRKYEKFKYELGRTIGKEFKYPEVLNRKYPSFISSPWIRISGLDLLWARFLTPLRKIKRSIL